MATMISELRKLVVSVVATYKGRHSVEPATSSITTAASSLGWDIFPCSCLSSPIAQMRSMRAPALLVLKGDWVGKLFFHAPHVQEVELLASEGKGMPQQGRGGQDRVGGHRGLVHRKL